MSDDDPDLHAHAFVQYAERGMNAGSGSTGQRFFRCRCGLEERRRYLEGRLFEVRYRLDQLATWVDPIRWLSVELPVVICPRCEGQRFDVGTCGVCGSLGILDERCKRLPEVTRA